MKILKKLIGWIVLFNIMPIACGLLTMYSIKDTTFSHGYFMLILVEIGIVMLVAVFALCFKLIGDEL